MDQLMQMNGIQNWDNENAVNTGQPIDIRCMYTINLNDPYIAQ